MKKMTKILVLATVFFVLLCGSLNAQDESSKVWNTLRSNPGQHKGEVVTLRLKVWIKHSNLGYLIGNCGSFGKDVRVTSVNPYIDLRQTKPRAKNLLEVFDTTYADDWIRVTGEFVGIDDYGRVVLYAISIVNEGYKER